MGNKGSTLEGLATNEGTLPEPIRIRAPQTTPRPTGDYELEWARCTKAAQELWVSINKNRIRIAKLALEVCDIQHGGGNHWSGFKGVKTLKQFAEDSGVTYKTLHRYVEIYRKVYQNLEYAKWDDRNFGAANRTLNRIQSLKDVSKETVNNVYEEERNRKGSSSRLLTVLKLLKTVDNHLMKIEWDECNQEEVNEVTARLNKCFETYNAE